MPASSHTLDRIAVTFDDDRAVADAGLLLTGTLMGRLGLESAADAMVGVGYRPGRKLATLVHTLVAGGDCIDDVALLHAGATGRILGHDTVAPSTIGTWLRAFTFGHVRQLDRVTEAMLTRAWAAGAGPGDDDMFVDVDSTIAETHGYQKQGAAYGYTKTKGYHPLLATRADTGEVLHARMRKGSANTGRGAQRFVREVVGRVRRAGATGKIILRADAGFWSRKVIAACTDHGVDFSITVTRQKVITDAIEAIPETAWVDIDYTDGGAAQVAETNWAGWRLIVRRTRIDNDPAVARLFPEWRHHAFVTNRHGDPIELDADHRAHAVVELAIRDLKHGAGLNHCPSGIFTANAAWLVATTLAHNLVRWVQLLGVTSQKLQIAKTLRRRLLSLPGRLTRSARRWTLHLPTRWPWRAAFEDTLSDCVLCPRSPDRTQHHEPPTGGASACPQLPHHDRSALTGAPDVSAEMPMTTLSAQATPNLTVDKNGGSRLRPTSAIIFQTSMLFNETDSRNTAPSTADIANPTGRRDYR